jgi:hypothetical protein
MQAVLQAPARMHAAQAEGEPMTTVRTDYSTSVKQLCRGCGRTISYQQWRRHGMCGACYNTNIYGIKAGLYVLVKMVNGRPRVLPGIPLYANELRTMFKDDAIRIGQVVERWTPGMGNVEYGELYHVVSCNGSGLALEPIRLVVDL